MEEESDMMSVYGALEGITKKQFHLAGINRIIKRFVKMRVGWGLVEEVVVWPVERWRIRLQSSKTGGGGSG